MCAIFGTKNKEQFDSLYELNHKRGGFAFSVVFRNKEGKFMTTKGREYIKPLSNAKYILAHDQAPTSSVGCMITVLLTRLFVVSGWWRITVY